MQYIVYKITFPNDKVYIGITSQSLDERKRKHYSRAFKNCKYKLYKAIRKYKNINWEIIDISAKNRRQLCNLEEYYIRKYDSYKNGYNSTLGGELNLGRKVSNKTRKKLRELNLGKNNPNYGKKRSLQTRLKSAKSNGTFPFSVFKKDTNEFIGDWSIIKQCARDLKLNYQIVANCLKNRRNHKSHKGYVFKYIEERSC